MIAHPIPFSAIFPTDKIQRTQSKWVRTLHLNPINAVLVGNQVLTGRPRDPKPRAVKYGQIWHRTRFFDLLFWKMTMVAPLYNERPKILSESR